MHINEILSLVEDGKGQMRISQSASTTCDHAGTRRRSWRDCWAIRGCSFSLVCRYPPTSEWITGRTIYSKPLSEGALQIYERRRPFNRLAQSSLTAVVKPPFPACLPRLSPFLSRETLSFSLRLLPRFGSAWLGSTRLSRRARMSALYFIPKRVSPIWS